MEQRLRQITGNTVPVGFEKAKLEKVVKWLLQQAMKRRNRFLTLKDLKWDTDKIGRIETRLESRYSQHVIYHRYGMGDLEGQLLRVRSAIHDDLPDAEQILCRLLEYAPLKKDDKKEKPEDTHFNWLLKKEAKRKKKTRNKGNPFTFGKKRTKHWAVPAKESWQ